ncbi:MAG: alternative ribosome rescue aminoacyl-tRNA hydrolase ArfB [Bacteroidota bacterium]
MQPHQNIQIPASECEMTAVHASGPGGQHVNKVASAIQLRFDIMASSLPPDIKTKLINYKDKRITNDGVILIKAQNNRSQLQNREEALKRLNALIKSATKPVKVRKATKPNKGAVKARLKAKSHRSAIKKLRAKVDLDD